MLGGGIQCFRFLFRVYSLAADACDDYLLKLFEFTVQKAVDANLFKIVADNAAQIFRQPIIGDNIGQKASHHQQRNSIDQKPLFVPAPSAMFRQDRQIGRIEKDSVKSAQADVGTEKASKSDTIQLLLGPFRSLVVQFDAVAPAVCPQGKAKQGVSRPAAWVQKIHSCSCRKIDAAGDIAYMVKIRWIVSQANVVHETADDRRVRRFIGWERLGKILEHLCQLGSVGIHQ